MLCDTDISNRDSSNSDGSNSDNSNSHSSNSDSSNTDISNKCNALEAAFCDLEMFCLLLESAGTHQVSSLVHTFIDPIRGLTCGPHILRPVLWYSLGQ